MPLEGLKNRSEWDNAGQNVPVVHMFYRARNHPNGSPYPIKLETFLRAAGIKYAVDFSKPFSSKGKMPWMTFNKEDMTDSQMCIDHIIKVMPDKDLDAHLNDSEKAVARGFRALLEDNLYFVVVMKRWSYDESGYMLKVLAPPPGPKFLFSLVLPMAKKKISGQAKSQGIGLHTKEEVLEIGKRDLKALSDFLGEKQYLMGDQISTVDCVAFGFLCVVIYGFPEDDVHRVQIEEELPNLKAYTMRIKETYWPDWDDCQYKD